MGSWWDDKLKDTTPLEVPSSHAGMYTACDRTELVAGCDVDADKRAAFTAKWDIGRVYADYREMLAKEDLDVVSVVTSWASTQAKIVTDVSASGVRGIYTEKPVATSVNEIAGIVENVRKNRIAVVVPYVRRYMHGFVKARDLIQSGAIGQLVHIHTGSSGGLMHGGTHSLDYLNFLAGDPAPAWCVGRLEDMSWVPEGRWLRNDPLASGYIETTTGVRFTLDGASRAPVHALITGTEGHLVLMNEGNTLQLWKKSHAEDVVHSGGKALEVVPIEKQTRSLMYQALADLIHAMDTGEPTRCNESHAARALEMALGFHASARAGTCRVDFPLADRDLSVDTW